MKRKYEYPDLDAILGELTTYPDKEKQFREALEGAGGKVVAAEGREVADIVRELWPDAARVASNIPGVGTFNPDEVENAATLDGTDVAVVRGRFGVAENGAVWVEQDVRHRAVYFISEALVLLVPREEIVNNMHEAYARIEKEGSDRKFGAFIAGPSKTADIEQALVFGAHGARQTVVVLI